MEKRNTMSVYQATDRMDTSASIFAIDGDVMYVAYYSVHEDYYWLRDRVDMNGFISEPTNLSRIGSDAVLLRGTPVL